jgi:ATP-dependent Zn protease
MRRSSLESHCPSRGEQRWDTGERDLAGRDSLSRCTGRRLRSTKGAKLTKSTKKKSTKKDKNILGFIFVFFPFVLFVGFVFFVCGRGRVQRFSVTCSA